MRPGGAAAQRKRWMPELGSEIDWSHPLAQGLVSFTVPGIRYDFVTKTQLGSGGSFGPTAPSTVGLAYNSSGVTNGTLTGNVRTWDNSTAATIAVQAYSAGSSGVFCHWAGDIGTNGAALILHKTSSTAGGFAMWNRDISLSSVPWSENPVIVGTVAGSSQKGYVNGVLNNSAANSRVVPTSRAVNIGGGGNGFPWDGTVSWGAIWVRELSEAEVISLTADPFQFLTV